MTGPSTRDSINGRGSGANSPDSKRGWIHRAAIPLTSDMSRCDSNSRTQYAFSYTYTLNGTPINQYVYCLIGLGSYAR